MWLNWKDVINDVRQCMYGTRACKIFETSLSGNWVFLWNMPNDCKERLGRIRCNHIQSLLSTDQSRRFAFCQWFVNNFMNDDLLNLTFF